ncbi:MAG: L-threonylcarbamoyladenylate synthase [Legionella sp.]
MAIITTDINLALCELQQGNVIAIPTETVYGLAADATNEDAVKKIFAIKQRPLNHPLIMHVCHDWDLNQWVKNIPHYAQELMIRFWPGALTLVFNCKSNVIQPLVNGGQDTIAIRAPNHPLTEHLLRTLNRPLVAPSANPFGQISPTTAQHVAESFPDDNFLILDGGRCNIGIESSIILATDDNEYCILRPGMLDLKDIGNGLIDQPTAAQLLPRVSGQLETHYQPHKKLYYVDDWQQFDDISSSLPTSIYTISLTNWPRNNLALHHQLPNDPKMVAYQFYHQLRYADLSEAAVIVIELPPNDTMWQAIRDKIVKAGKRLTTEHFFY